MFKAIKSGRYDFPSPFWDDIQPGAKDMIGCLLMLDTEKRYTAQQVKTKKTTTDNLNMQGTDRSVWGGVYSISMHSRVTMDPRIREGGEGPAM